MRIVPLPRWPATGAALLALTAYPSERAKRDRFFQHAMAGLSKAHGTAWRELPSELRGKRPEKIVNTVNRGLWRIQGRRYRAAYLALWELDGGEHKAGSLGLNFTFPGRPKARDELMRALAERCAADAADCFDEANFQRRIVAESRPALAISIALLLAGRPLVEVLREELACRRILPLAAEWALRLSDPKVIVPVVNSSDS